MNVNMKSRARGIHTRRQRRGWTASQLGVALMIVALVYSCWFFIVISKLGDNSSASSGSDSDSGSNSFKDHLFQKIKKGKGDILLCVGEKERVKRGRGPSEASNALARGVWGHAPPEIYNFQPSLVQYEHI